MNIPENDFDICFASERIHRQIFRPGKITDLSKPISMEHFLTDLPDNITAPGTDGYFLSRQGAQKLLDMVQVDGVAGDVDWRLIYYTATSQGMAQLNPDSYARKALKLHQSRHKVEKSLKTFSSSLPIIHIQPGRSSRLDSNEFDHAHLE